MIKLLYACALPLLIAAGNAAGSTVFSGLDHEFNYAGGLDFTLAENQDRITSNVWITRGLNRGIFNIAQEEEYNGISTFGTSPIGTLWAFGTAADYDTLDYTAWGMLANQNPRGLVGRDIVVYLEDDDFYIELQFTFWGGNSTDGAFSYIRSDVPAPTGVAVIALGGVLAARRRR